MHVIFTNLTWRVFRFPPFHFFFENVQWSYVFSSFGIKFQIIEPKYLIELDPFSTVLFCKITKTDFERR